MRIKNIILCLIALIVFISCATDFKRGPEGGPNDKFSPTVAFASINDTALNMDKNSTIEIKFSEFIDINSSKNAINISPRSAQKKSKILWYDKSIKVNFNSLEDNQTVVITINPSLKDTQGNALIDSYSLSFSTGDKIDKKSISGSVNGAINKNIIVPVNYSKIKVNLYSILKDSINFNKAEPEYSVGLSKDYIFELKNLSSGIYTLIAFNDINNDSKPQFETEMIGFIDDQVNLNDKENLNYDLSLGYNDTEPPFIKNTTTIRNDIIKIEFSEELSGNHGFIDSLLINGNLAQFEEYITSNDKKNIYVKTELLKIGDIVKIKLKEISDDFGNMIKPNFKAKVHTVTDTIPRAFFRLTSKLPNKIETDQKLSFTTSYFENDSLSVQLMLMKDSVVTQLTNGVIYEPYKFIVDLKENHIEPDEYECQIIKADSVVYKSKLVVEESKGFGYVSGNISGSSSENFVLICKNINGVSKVEKISGNNYKIKILPGKYLCAMTTDKNTDGIFNTDFYNSISEKAVFINDTILVRKNWETTDINFEFKK